MVIYIELVLIVNILLHLFLIIFIHNLFYIRYRKYMIIGLILDGMYMLLYIYNFLLYDYLKYIFPFILVILSFKTNFYTYLKITFVYFILSYVLGGMSYTINLSGNLEYVVILVVFLFILLILMFFYKSKVINAFYDLSFKYRNKSFHVNAFLDTGCNIWYKEFPVIVLNKKYQFDIYTNEFISINTGLASSKAMVYYIDQLKIDKTVINCYCVFLDIEYEAIIGCNVL